MASVVPKVESDNLDSRDPKGLLDNKDPLVHVVTLDFLVFLVLLYAFHLFVVKLRTIIDIEFCF